MEDSEIDEHERTKHREAISREVDEVVEARLRDRQPVKRDWVIQEILSRHPLPDSLEPTKRDFLLWCVKLIVGEEVDPILVRRGLQRVPGLEPMPILHTADELRAFGEQCDAHAAELEQYLEARKKDRAHDN